MYSQDPSASYSGPYGTCYPSRYDTVGFSGQTPGYMQQQMGDYPGRGYYQPSFWHRHKKAVVVVVALVLILGGGTAALAVGFAKKGFLSFGTDEMDEWLGNTTRAIAGEGEQHNLEGAKLSVTAELPEVGSAQQKVNATLAEYHEVDGGKEPSVVEIISTTSS